MQVGGLELKKIESHGDNVKNNRKRGFLLLSTRYQLPSSTVGAECGLETDSTAKVWGLQETL